MKRKSNINCGSFIGEFVRALASRGKQEQKKERKEHTGYAAARISSHKEFGEYFTSAYCSFRQTSILMPTYYIIESYFL